MIRSIRIGPYDFFQDDSNQVGLEQLQNGINYEKHVVAELQKWIPNCQGFADIGANAGIHTIIAKSIRPGVPIVCAEASPHNISLLLRNIAHNKLTDVTVLPFPLSEKPQILRMNSFEPNSVCSVDGTPDSEDFPKLAASLNLDSLRLTDIDLIKLDVEGFEIRVLNGARYAFQDEHRIIFEFCPEVCHRSGLTPEQTLQWFFDNGYKLTMLDYVPGARKECKTPQEVIEHLGRTSKLITDILAEQ